MKSHQIQGGRSGSELIRTNQIVKHLVRLLRMGQEILQHGEVRVKRPDAEELVAIRDGSWTYDELIKYADHMNDRIQNVWYKSTMLPKKPNVKFAAKLLMETQNMVWGV